MKKNFKVNEPKNVPLIDVLRIFSQENLELKFSGKADDLRGVKIKSPDIIYYEICETFTSTKGLAPGRIGFLSSKVQIDPCDLGKVVEYGLTCLFVSEEQYHNFKSIIDSLKVPVLIYENAKEEAIKRALAINLQYLFAPNILLHGSAVEVFGEGVLIIGDPNVGKSECVLELVQRGHYFIADDLIKLTSFPCNTISISSGCEESQFKFFLEIRKLGIIDMLKLFGPRSVKDKSELSLVVEITVDKDEVVSKKELPDKYIKFFEREIPYLVISIGERGIMATKIEVAILEYKARKFGFRSEKIIQDVLGGKKHDKKTS